MKPKYINIVADFGEFQQPFPSVISNNLISTNPVPEVIEEVCKEDEAKRSTPIYNLAETTPLTIYIENTKINSILARFIEKIKLLDSDHVNMYQLEISDYNDSVNFNLHSIRNIPNSIRDNLIDVFNFNFRCSDNNLYVYLSSLYILQKYVNVGSSLLTLLKEFTTDLVNLFGYTNGFIELYSVDTALMFYIKNNLIPRCVYFMDGDPIEHARVAERVIGLAQKNKNKKLIDDFIKMKKGDSTAFLEFSLYLFNNTIEGEYYRYYIKQMNEFDTNVYESILLSKFMNTIFDGSMI